MSEPIYLACHGTRQVVHVAEMSSAWFRGADCSVLVGAFCDAHYGQALVVLGAQGVDDAADASEQPYSEWTTDNFGELMREVLGRSIATEQKILIVKSKLDDLKQ